MGLRKKKKTRQRTGGPEKTADPKRLEPEGSTEDDDPGVVGWIPKRRRAGQFWISKTKRSRGIRSIFQNWINTLAVSVVEGVQHGCAELKRRTLRYLNLLDNREVRDVRDVVRHYVAGRVAERRRKDMLSGEAVHDEAHLVFCDEHHGRGGRA